jgi:uncharacterized protein YjbI with pentapeptide repeats
MANPEHVELVKQGVEAIAAWRAAHPDGRLDLEKAELEGIQLCGANLQGARLHEAHLQGANLSAANLQHAGLRDAQLVGADLRGARLQRSRLVKTNLMQANLAWARFYRAHLHGVYLQEANLENANLQDAYLLWASLVQARLHGAYLDRAEMQWANLQAANLHQARLQGVNLQEAVVGHTGFEQTCLHGALGLDTCRHQAPSRFDVGSLARSGHLPEVFLTHCGWSPELVEQALTHVEASAPLGVIERAVALPLAWQPSAVGWFSHVVALLQQRHPDVACTSRIEQDATMLRLLVEIPEKHRETIEQTVQAFGSVLAGQTRPEAFFTHDLDARHFLHQRDHWYSVFNLPREPLAAFLPVGGQALSVDEQGQLFCQLLGNVLTDR